jgi:hypothetical protein
MEHPEGKPKALVHQWSDQLIEGRSVAVLRPADEVGAGG